MVDGSKSAIIISATSDIGTALWHRWSRFGWNVYGTYRNHKHPLVENEGYSERLVYCDGANVSSIDDACMQLREQCSEWDVLVNCIGTQNPIGTFATCNFSEWEKSVSVNFVNQLRIIHELLPTRRVNSCNGPCVLLFAGGGTNNAVHNYSAYTISKIALIKMCELLDAELPDTRFTIIGPGWVKTKIHDATLQSGVKAGMNYQRTVDMMRDGTWTSMDEVLDCCDWVIKSSHQVVGGRNFSVVHDKWGTQDLAHSLLGDQNLYKLRRAGNDLFVNENLLAS